MEQRSSNVATLRAVKGVAALGHASGELQPKAMWGAGLDKGPSLVPAPGRRLGRQATLSKSLRHMEPPAALPLFDMSVAVLDSLNMMRASMEEEVVLQSTLAVPAHQALACRIEAYGTPFGAPTLHAELTEDDLQFAACLAAPPDFDATPGHLDTAASLQRMASISALQTARLPGGGGAPEPAAATEAAGVKAARGGGGSELLRMPSIQTEKKDKKAQGWRKDLSATAGADEAAAAAAGGGAVASVSTPEGRAVLAALARDAAARERVLFHGCKDLVAAMVGAGYLLLRAARFNRGAPAAVEGLRRMSSLRREDSGAAARAAGVLPWGAGPTFA